MHDRRAGLVNRIWGGSVRQLSHMPFGDVRRMVSERIQIFYEGERVKRSCPFVQNIRRSWRWNAIRFSWGVFVCPYSA